VRELSSAKTKRLDREATSDREKKATMPVSEGDTGAKPAAKNDRWVGWTVEPIKRQEQTTQDSGADKTVDHGPSTIANPPIWNGGASPA